MSDKLVIIGGGPAATNALETIRRFDSSAEVTLVCDEPAHSRMALPYWLAGKIPQQQTHTGDASYFERLRAATRFGNRVTKIDVDRRLVSLDSDEQLPFDRLLIATGSVPLPLPIPGADLPGVEHLWTLAQTSRVLQAAEQRADVPRVVLIGAGFIGLIVLSAMFKRGWRLTVVEREPQVLPRMLDRASADLVSHWLTSRGVTVHCGVGVEAIDQRDAAKEVRLSDGKVLPADIVIVAAGVRPNIDLVRDTPIAVDHGILVDSRLQTNVPGIFAAGDVAQGPVRGSDRREVHAIQPTAVDHGRVAGANMVGQSIDYPGSLPMNVLDVCGLQCASFGQWQAADSDTMTICNPRDFVYRSLHWTGDRVTGALFVGRANHLGMLTDVGMVKGLIQTGVALGPWKEFLRENPFDVRRPFVACDVPRRLLDERLLGVPAAPRGFRYDDAPARHKPGSWHAVYVDQGN